jgi:hypothetical protein
MRDRWSSLLRRWKLSITLERPAALVDHTLRVGQRDSLDWRQTLPAARIVCSMGLKANCWDNAQAQSTLRILNIEDPTDQNSVLSNEAIGLRRVPSASKIRQVKDGKRLMQHDFYILSERGLNPTIERPENDCKLLLHW